MSSSPTLGRRMRLALFLFAISYALGLPLLFALEALAAATGWKMLGLYIAPGIYMTSHIIWGAAFLLGGAEAVNIVKAWFAKRKRRRIDPSAVDRLDKDS